MVRSLIEGATYAMRDSLERIRSLGVPIHEIRVSGGGAKSPLWRQLQADVYGQNVAVINAEEGPAYGASLLAAVGAGFFQSVPEACSRFIRVVSRTKTSARAKAEYDRRYPMFGRLYQSLKADFPDLGR